MGIRPAAVLGRRSLSNGFYDWQPFLAPASNLGAPAGRPAGPRAGVGWPTPTRRRGPPGAPSLWPRPGAPRPPASVVPSRGILRAVCWASDPRRRANGKALPSSWASRPLIGSPKWRGPKMSAAAMPLLLWFRRCYEFHRLKNVTFTLLIALVVFVVWITPQQFLNFAPRTIGFDPQILGKTILHFTGPPFRFVFSALLLSFR